MKKLLLTLLILVGLAFQSYAEERVNLICELYQVVYAHDPLEIHKVYDAPESLVIFPESKKLIHYGSSEKYIESKDSNRIVWAYFKEENHWRRFYSLDRTTGILTETLQGDGTWIVPKPGALKTDYQNYSISLWQCKQSENLF